MRERIGLGGFKHTQASECVDAINVHRTATADAFAATSSEGQGGIEFVLDPDQSIQHHWPGLVQVDRVRLHLRLGCRLVGIPPIDVESLHLRILRGVLLRNILIDRRKGPSPNRGCGSCGWRGSVKGSWHVGRVESRTLDRSEQAGGRP